MKLLFAISHSRWRVFSTATAGLLAALAFAVAATPAAAAPTVVSLEFDHGSLDHRAVGQSLVNHGMRGTFFLVTGKVGDPDTMDWDQIADLARAGHEIGGHTVNHRDPATLTPEEQRDEVCIDRANLLAHGYEARSFAYPGQPGALASAIVQGCGYNSGRQDGGIRAPDSCFACPFAETIPPANFFATRTPPVIEQSNSLARMQHYITQAEDNGGGWVQLVFAQVCTPCGRYGVDPATFEALLSWLEPRAQRGTIVRRVQDVIAGFPLPNQMIPATDTVPPIIATLSVSRKRFAVARRGTARVARIRKGTILRYSVSEPARITFNIQRVVRRKCRGARPTARRCHRFLPAGQLVRRTAKLRNRNRFTGRIGRKALRSGRYRAVVRAVDSAGNRGRLRIVRFNIIRPR